MARPEKAGAILILWLSMGTIRTLRNYSDPAVGAFVSQITVANNRPVVLLLGSGDVDTSALEIVRSICSALPLAPERIAATMTAIALAWTVTSCDETCSAPAKGHVFEQLTSVLTKEPHASLSRVSRLVGVNRHCLERLVRQIAGSTFREWRRRVCMIAAEAHLRRGDSVKSVAIDAGYRSQRAFSRAFRATFGASPSQFKRSALGGTHRDLPSKRLHYE